MMRSMMDYPELLEWQKALLDQRLKDAEAHPDDWVSWDEAKQRLERRIDHGTYPSPSPTRL